MGWGHRVPKGPQGWETVTKGSTFLVPSHQRQLSIRPVTAIFMLSQAHLTPPGPFSCVTVHWGEQSRGERASGIGNSSADCSPSPFTLTSLLGTDSHGEAILLACCLPLLQGGQASSQRSCPLCLTPALGPGSEDLHTVTLEWMMGPAQYRKSW